MTRVISTKIQVMIALLAMVCAGGAYGLYDYLIPMKDQKESEVARVRGEIEAKRAEVAKLKEEFVLLQIQLRKFKDLEANGFFNNQNRVKAQESFDKLRQLSGLLKARYDIKSGALSEVKQASDANHVVLMSPVTVEIESLDDVDVYTFIKGLEEKFPGSVDMTRVELKRTEQFSPAVLRKIGAGEPLKLIEATVEFDWRTMANRDRLNETDTSSSTVTTGTQTVSMQPAVVSPQTAPGTAPVQQQPQTQTQAAPVTGGQ